MGSPFPGMDPYLEGEMWQEFHQRLAGIISAQLLPHLKPKYVALLAKRYVVQSVELGIVGSSPRVVDPDVHVAYAEHRLHEGSSGTLVAEPAAELISPLLEEVPVVSIEIRDVAQRRLVTLIEILSPANKQGKGAIEYAERRLELLQTHTHVLELDLLRQGERFPLQGNLPSGSYYVFLSRANRRPRTEVWPIALRDRLPTIPVPLLPPDADVPLNLQTALDECFSLVGYEQLLDYTVAPPPPALNDSDKTWAAEQIRSCERRR